MNCIHEFALILLIQLNLFFFLSHSL